MYFMTEWYSEVDIILGKLLLQILITHKKYMKKTFYEVDLSLINYKIFM